MRQLATTIQGDRILLRPFQEGDAEEAARVWTPELRYMYGGSRIAEGRPAAESRQRDHEQIAASGEHHFAIEADGRYIGWLGLRVNDAEQGASYRIGIENPEYWGRGYGTEVARLVLRYAFATLGLHRVHLRVAAYNVRARRSYEKCGFRVEGIERQSFQVDGEWQDDVLMAILQAEWEAHRAEGAATPNGVTIRSYRPADYDQVIAIWREAWGNGRPGDAPAALAYHQAHDPGPFLVAELDGRVVGTVLGSWDGRWAWITRLAVHPDYRRRGLGKLLMAEVERRLAALGASFAALLTGRRNEASLAFYANLGYADHEHIACLSKSLTGKEVDGCGHGLD